LALDFQHCARPFRVRQRISNAPSGHGESFRKRPSDAQTASQLWPHRSSAEDLCRRIYKAEVTFVRDDIKIALNNNLHNLLELSRWNYAPRRIAGRVQNDQTGLWRDCFPDHLGSQDKVVIFSLDKNRLAAREGHDFGKRNPVRFGNQHFVAGIDQGNDRVKNSLFAAGRRHYLVTLVSCAKLPLIETNNGLL